MRMTQAAKFLVSAWRVGLVGMVGMVVLLLAGPVWSAGSRKSLPKRAWKKDLSKTCRVSRRQIVKVHPYLLRRAGATTGLLLASVWKSRAKKVSVLHALTYRRCTRGWCPGRCLTLFEERCAAKSKPACEHQFRASQLIDLQASSTDVQPDDGSWFGNTVLEPKTKARWPLLLIQSKTIHGAGDQRRSQTQTVLLSLRTQQPRPLFKLVTMKRWPVVLIAGRKQDPVGQRIRELQFRHNASQPIELTTIQRPIPSPFDKCCKPKDTYKQYQLSSEGFQEVQSL